MKQRFIIIILTLASIFIPSAVLAANQSGSGQIHAAATDTRHCVTKGEASQLGISMTLSRARKILDGPGQTWLSDSQGFEDGSFVSVLGRRWNNCGHQTGTSSIVFWRVGCNGGLCGFNSITPWRASEVDATQRFPYPH